MLVETLVGLLMEVVVGALVEVLVEPRLDMVMERLVGDTDGCYCSFFGADTG